MLCDLHLRALSTTPFNKDPTSELKAKPGEKLIYICIIQNLGRKQME